MSTAPQSCCDATTVEIPRLSWNWSEILISEEKSLSIRTIESPAGRRHTRRGAPLSQGGAATAAGLWQRKPGAQSLRRKLWGFIWRCAPNEAAEPADKPGSVVSSHSSRRSVTATLKQPTRRHRGPRHCLPIWPCSRWGLPCRSVAGLAVRSYRTISPLPSCLRSLRRYLSVALSVGSRRPGVTWHRALWSPDFPRHPCG